MNVNSQLWCGKSKRRGNNFIHNKINLDLNLDGVYNDFFYDNLDGVCNVLDNAPKHLYTDQMCVYYNKPLLESVTQIKTMKKDWMKKLLISW